MMDLAVRHRIATTNTNNNNDNHVVASWVDPEGGGGGQNTLSSLALPSSSPMAVDSSASSSEDAKYTKTKKKRRTTKKKLQQQKPKHSTARLVGIAGLFIAVLSVYHVTIKVQRDRRRHAKAMYQRAEMILQNLQQHHDDNENDDEQQQQQPLPPPGMMRMMGPPRFPPAGYYPQQPPQQGYRPPPPVRGGYPGVQQRPPPLEYNNAYPQQQQQQQPLPPPGYEEWRQAQQGQLQQQPRPYWRTTTTGYNQQPQQEEEEEEEEEENQYNNNNNNNNQRQLEQQDENEQEQEDPIEGWHVAEQAFATQRRDNNGEESLDRLPQILKDWRDAWDATILQNLHGGVRWVRPYLLPEAQEQEQYTHYGRRDHRREKVEEKQASTLLHAARKYAHMAWQEEMEQFLVEAQNNNGGGTTLPGPAVDYTNPAMYEYPQLLPEPPAEGGYPAMSTMAELMEAWDQDEDYNQENIIAETLLHFDYTNPQEMAMAKRFRDAMVPFKLVNVPELIKAGELWTDNYLTKGFGGADDRDDDDNAEFDYPAAGYAQESPNNYFSFFVAQTWDVKRTGVPPVRTTDLDFAQWAAHARYADAVRLDADQPHFYWQSGVPPQERHQPQETWTFISRDLPSFSATEPNFIMFHPDQEKGIQCRFGERGVVAATHYDEGRNFVGMITGAKRYILSPPNACGKLGIVTERKSSVSRHSALNFGHLKYLNDPDASQGMSTEEREWLTRAASAPAVETVLKAGEALYIPSFWFHYIISLQKSAQCNARSGKETEVHFEFGGADDVHQCPTAIE